MNILITGGAGFIGANVADHYLTAGHTVSVFDNLSRPGVSHNLDWLKASHPASRLRALVKDVRDDKALIQAVKNQDVVFHFAGQTAVTTSIKDPRLDFEINVLGTINLLEALRTQNPEAILLYSSTNKVYGDVSRVRTRKRQKRYYSVESPSIDESEKLDFYSPYGCSKGAGDQYVHDYARIYGLKTIVFRQSCIYGTHQFGVEDQGWLAHFTAQVIQNEPITIFGDGKQVRDILYITDLVRAFDQAVSKIDITAGEIYNMGGGIDNTVSLLELIDHLESLHGSKIKLKFKPSRQGDQKVFISNIDKAKRDLDWQPEVSASEGITLLYRWLKDYLVRT